jgi:uncharacterized protein YjbJ (UPF0337 family)
MKEAPNFIGRSEPAGQELGRRAKVETASAPGALSDTLGMEDVMNKDQAAGGWKEIKGKLKQQWGKLTDDDLTVLEGASDELSGRIQKRYGIAKEEAEKQVETFRRTNRDLMSNW